MEQPDTAEGHGNAVTVAGINDLLVADGTTGLHNSGHAAAAGALDVVAKGEEGITAQGNAGDLIQPGTLFLCGEGRGLFGEGFGPDIVSNDKIGRASCRERV